MTKSAFKVGDIIGFSGSYFASHLINLSTYGIPWYSLSHVGIIANRTQGACDSLVVFEANENCEWPCVIAQRKVSGVQAHWISDIIEDYKGTLWHYRLSKQLNRTKIRLLTKTLKDKIGTPYDWDGAKKAGGYLYSAACAIMYGEDVDSMFCSELVAYALQQVGICDIQNASRWNPNSLMRRLTRDSVFDNGIKIDRGE